jgi:hypothetical protein
MKEKNTDIIYNGRRIYVNLSSKQCREVLQELSERFDNGEEIDPNLIEIEDSIYGTEE